MAAPPRRSLRNLRLPINLFVMLVCINITLMVCWIYLLVNVNSSNWGALTVGIILFVLMLVGLSLYLALTIKEVRLNLRQANFVDSVTHELKTPLAAMRLYLDTLRLRPLSEEQRLDFYQVMDSEVSRLDRLIDQLLEVGRLDAIGQFTEVEDVNLEVLLRDCAQTACAHHHQKMEDVVQFDLEPCRVRAASIILEIIFRNLLENALKYAGQPPRVGVSARLRTPRKIQVQISDNGEGVPYKIRKKIFQMFYRGENELERKRKGTGLGLYIVYTLVHKLKGRIKVLDRAEGSGSVFEVELPGVAES